MGVQWQTNITKRFILYGIAATLISTAGYLIAPVEVRFLNTLTENKTLVGLTFALGSLFFAILSFILGRLSDKYGRGRFIILGAFFSVIAPLFYATTANIFQYMGIKFVWAFAGVAMGPILLAQLQDIIHGYPKRGQLMGTLYSAQAISGSLGAFLGGFLTSTYSFQAAYLAMSFLGLLALIFLISMLGLITEKPKHYEKRHLLFSIKYIFSRPQLIFYFFANTGFSLNWGLKPFIWPLIIFGLSNSDTITGSIFATMGIVAFLILPFAGKYIDKTKSFFKPAVYSFLFLGIFGLILSFTKNIWIFWTAASFYAVGEALYGPTQAVLLTDHIESKYRGEILGFDAVYDRILGAISPFFAGFLLSLFAPQGVLLIYVLLFWITLIILNIIYQKKIKASETA